MDRLVFLHQVLDMKLKLNLRMTLCTDNMNRICTLLLFFVSGLTQDSPNPTLFLISAPEILHAGSPTPIAITVFADFPGNLTAEVEHGNTKVAQTGIFQGGVTSVFMLPPFPGSLSQNSLLNLTVRGYRENRLLFTNTTTLTFNPWTVSSFIQTDRSNYTRGDTVKVRVVSFQLDNKPYKGRVHISLLDPSGKPVDSWNSTGNLGIVLKEFRLPQSSRLGQWVITTTVNGVTNKKSFIVEHHDGGAPSFDVMVKTSSQVLLGDDISGSVRALYSHGQPVHGTLDVMLKAFINNRTSPSLQTQTKQIYGSAQFFFSRDQLQSLYSSSATSNNSHILHIAAQVNDSTTGLTVNKTVEVHVLPNKFQLTFLNFPSTLKPSLNFTANLRIVRYDRQSLSSLDLKHFAVVQVTQRTSLIYSTTMSLTLPVPKNGNILIQFQLQPQVEMLFIEARFQSNEETLRMYANYSSPTGSYIQIIPVNTLPTQIGLPLQLNVESTNIPERLHFVVSSKGQVVAAGTESFSSSVALTPELSWYPEACVTVYYMHPDGEIITDTIYISIQQYNNVTLHWGSERAQPGEQVSLTVAASESMFQVLITVTAMQNDALQSDLDPRVEQKCNLRMMTNARFYMKNQADGLKNEGDKYTRLILEQYWNHWVDAAESLLWLDTNVSDKSWTSGKITVPDGVTALGAVALVMSENLGLSFTPVAQKLTISKDFSLSLVVPPLLVRGEEIVLEVNVINHLEQDTEVIVLVAQSEAFEFVLMNRRGASVVNAQKLTLGSHASASALFPIRALAVGEMEISVDAVSAEASDGLVGKIWVKPEGVEQTFSHTLFLEGPLERQDFSRSLSFSFPPNLVPGSQRAHIALVGDFLALSIENLDSLVQFPTGCGEQNMIHFAPSVYVLQYLEKSAQDDAEIRSKAQSYLMQGYEKQLSYQRDDGSFSAFGKSDISGSTWLTAFVLRCFLKAQPYMQIDQTVLTKATAWLLKHQGSQGEFTEVGKLIHTEMQGGTDDSSVALTAYVLLAFLEDKAYSEMYAGNVSLALRYLESKVSSDVVGNYSLCLVAYALALGSSPLLDSVISELSRRADYRDGVMMWTISRDPRSNNQHQHSAQIEMASYVLLALFLRGNFIEGITLMKWLSTQRNYLGGFGTTQDTVVALQVLAYYAAFSGANAINLKFNISSPVSSSALLFHINSTNYRVYQSREINADKDLPLNIYMKGRGFAIFQLNVFYNVKTTPDVVPVTDEDAFRLDVNLTDSDSNHILLSICTRLKDTQAIAHTGMAILEVGILSGFVLLPGAEIQADFIRKVDREPQRVSLYLDSVTKAEACVRLPFVRNYNVAHVQDAVLQVYDYYEPTRKTTRMYNSDSVHKRDSCSFCGKNCDSCRPGITIAVRSRSTIATSCSLTSLFLGAIVFLVSV
ncbi:CD109 antigen-like isoform X2 [Girardinichthys multiradiatus]|uniref:CD109 antigen-like isoform X2 n=1 Tax=Girardinichthys multiradiatus TaxID=208333 RepID=UPI001FAE3FD2|nr:CD109 antigen-like isoform X2 [Girardinichthys multiradiatus]